MLMEFAKLSMVKIIAVKKIKKSITRESIVLDLKN